MHGGQIWALKSEINGGWRDSVFFVFHCRIPVECGTEVLMKWNLWQNIIFISIVIFYLYSISLHPLSHFLLKTIFLI